MKYPNIRFTAQAIQFDNSINIIIDIEISNGKIQTLSMFVFIFIFFMETIR